MGERLTNNKDGLILIVDNIVANIQILGHILRADGYEILSAANGPQALELAKEWLPDLILLDIIMPEMDGFEVCRQLKAIEETRQIPIMFLTAKTEYEDVIRGLDIGACDYVTKPFCAKELRARVRAHVELKRNKDSLIKSNDEQQKLLHVLCHDLANPISSIISLITLIRPLCHHHEAKEYLDLLAAAANNASDVIALVRASRNENSEGPPRLESVSLADAISTAAAILRQKFTAKDIRLKLAPEDRALMPAVIAERCSLVTSVISNLLTNAIKFSWPGGEILIEAKNGPEPGTVTVRVIDHGIGIPSKLLETLFQDSARCSREGTRGELGAGYGMPLVKKYMEFYGGTIKILSRQGKSPDDPKGGTTVVLTFKAAE